MKTKSRNLLISVLLMVAMLLGVFAITPLTAFAVSDTNKPAETVYVGGVALNAGQYVKNGETTATTGAPAEDATGYAWYSDARILILKDYTYQGRGYEYSSGNYALVYSTGKLEVSLNGENTLKQTESGKDGICTVGALRIRNAGSLTIEGNSCYCLYSNNIIEFQANLGTVNLKSTGNGTAIVSNNNDGDGEYEQAIIVYGGDIYVETFYPISNLTINGGGFKVSGSPALSTAPDISAYEGDYTITVSENQDGSNPVTYNQDNISNYNYFRIAPPAKTVINSVSVSGIELPQIGETFAPDETTLTYGGEYTAHYLIEKYTGTEWVEYTEDTDIIEHSVKYRLVLELAPKSGYTFSEDLTDNAVKINGKDGVVLRICPRDAFTNKVEVALEFSYEAPVTDYNITIAGKDGSATVGVDITIENYEDVLGDGTVSYNPTTNTLTLNNYVYNGEGVFVDDGGYLAITADVPIKGLTIVLVGENSITVSGSESAGMVFFGEGDLTVKGNGSLSINTIMYGITLLSDSGKLTIENAKLNITTTEAMAIGIQATDFLMTSGDVKINASMIGIGTSNEDGISINGGSVEIGSALGGYAFIYLDFAHETFNPIKPDLSGYVGAYKMTAGVNQDGSGASEFNESFLNSYKYAKLESVHVHDYGTAWESDANEHWNECECGDKANVAPHADENNDGKCDTCGYDLPVPEYIVSYNENGGSGTMVGDVIEKGGTFTLDACTYTAPEGKRFKAWAIGSVNGEQKQPNEQIIITAETYIYAIWEDIPVVKYNVSFNANGGSGTMLDETEQLGGYVLPGCTFTAPTGKQFKCWAEGSASGTQYSIGDEYDVTANVTFYAVWENIPVTNYTINATAGANGTISPSGEVTVAKGEDKTFTITANSGYHIKDVKVNGASVGTVSTYTFNDVAANATITVEFEVDTVPHVCNPTLVPKVEPNCTTAGKSAYYHCECGKNYEDAQGNSVISNLETWGILNALGHEAQDVWSTDGEYHWHKCTRCEEQLDKAAHSGGTATCTDKAVCEVCNTPYGNTTAHSHGSEWHNNADEHWNECACGDKANVAPHADTNNDGKCDTCGYTMTVIHTHNYGTAWESDANEHWNECECGDKANVAPHADENNDGKCDICDYAMGNAENPGGDKEPEKTGLSGGAIAGIAVGSVAVVGLGGFSLFWFVIKKKKFADLIALFKKK